MSDEWMGFAAGFSVATLVVGLLVSVIPQSKVYMYNEAIAACEKELPRGKECVIIAIPKEK